MWSTKVDIMSAMFNPLVNLTGLLINGGELYLTGLSNQKKC